MALRLYNSRTRSVEPFTPFLPGEVRIYVCGMTPSGHPHLGHARTFLVYDVLRRFLRSKGYRVTYVQNVTDIDDKIIERAQADGTSWDQVVAKFYGEYEVCAKRLGIKEPDVCPRATHEMGAIIELIAGLIEDRAAYESGDGVYFSVSGFVRYGRLSNRHVDELRAGERIGVREEKRDPLDFALWKKRKPGEPAWPSPWGEGRPGWHVECSAMARRYLGDQFDIHGGGTDLIFPHHENEVAQTETFTGKHPMARFWMHGGLLNVDGKKMSKSLGNFVPLTEMLDRYPPAAIRYFFLQTGYRKPISFNEDAIAGVRSGLRRLYGNLDALRAASPQGVHAPDSIDTSEFDAFLEDDLNTPGAIGWLQNRLAQERASRAAASAVVVPQAERCLDVLGLPPSGKAAELESLEALTADATATTSRNIGGELVLSDETRALFAAASGKNGLPDSVLVEEIVNLRAAAREAQDFAKADSLRNALARADIELIDTKDGTFWRQDVSRR